MALASFSITAGSPVWIVSNSRRGTLTQPFTLVRWWTTPFLLSTIPGSPAPMATTPGCSARRPSTAERMAASIASLLE